MSSSNQIRKYEPGNQKRKKKQWVEELIQSQKGAMERFIIKEPIVSQPKNQTQDTGIANDHNDGETGTDNILSNDGQAGTDNIVSNDGETVTDNIVSNDGETGTDNIVSNDGQAGTDNIISNDGETGTDNILSDNDQAVTDDAPFQPNIFDPRCWDSLHPQQVDILAQHLSTKWSYKGLINSERS